jgi:HPt (histidine-containing phosphotransfer) domain-containing protein
MSAESDQDWSPGAALDPESIARLRRLGGEALASKMASLFLGLAPDRIRTARAGLEAGDSDAVRNAAHSLKSSAGNIGAYAVLEAAGRLEDAAERGVPVAELVPLLAVLEAALEGAQTELLALAAAEEDPS